MSTPVNGPADVKVGDLVRVGVRHKRTGRSGIATVKKPLADKMTVEWHDGKTSTLAYSFEYRATWRREVRTHNNFHRLDAHERWRESRPETDAIDWRSEVSMDAIRTRPDDVCAQVRALSEWLKREPGKDEP